MTPLSRPPQRYAYVDHGPEIYVDSFATIRRETDLSGVPAGAERLAGCGLKARTIASSAAQTVALSSAPL